MPTKLLKQCVDEVLPMITAIINKSLKHGHFPSDLKHAHDTGYTSIVENATVKQVTGKLSKMNGILNRLKYIYPTHVLLTIYKSLFVPHINYGSLVWGQNFNSISKLQKKVIGTVTHSNYIAH